MTSRSSENAPAASAREVCSSLTIGTSSTEKPS
jgi:hypothetical protein